MKLPEIPQVAWFVYIIRADDDSLYTGITTDVKRRFQEHLEGPSGARYFNGRKPVEIVHIETKDSRSSASIREAEIKRMSRQRKLKLFSHQ